MFNVTRSVSMHSQAFAFCFNCSDVYPHFPSSSAKSAFKSDDGDGQAAAGGGAKPKKRSSIANVTSLEAFQFDAFLEI